MRWTKAVSVGAGRFIAPPSAKRVKPTAELLELPGQRSTQVMAVSTHEASKPVGPMYADFSVNEPVGTLAAKNSSAFS
jgi:hypothetical protein